ncbi:MAG: DUF2294 family protein [Firmicutes bacterium]|nr:DUF2294 family protein [Bacillota bacterium]
MSKQLGYMIRQIRERKEISQQKLSEISGLSQSFISSIENGQKSPTIRSLKELAGALDMSDEELVKTALFSPKNNYILQKNKLVTEINADLARLYKGVIGQGPKKINTEIYKDILIIRIKPYSNPILIQLVKTTRGQRLLNELARYLFKSYRMDFIKVLNNLIGVDIKNIYCDYSSVDEIVIIIRFNRKFL